MVDTSIAMGFRPIQIENPMNQLAQMLQIQQAQKQGQLADLNMQTAQRGFDESNKLRDYFANNDPTGPGFARGLYGISPDKGMAFEKALFDRKKDQADINSKNAGTDKTIAEALDKNLTLFRSAVPGITTPEAAGQYAAAMYDHPVLGKFASNFGTKDEAVQRNMAAFAKDPRGWQVASAGVSADKLLESLKGTRQNVSLGGTNRGETVNYYGELVPGQTTTTAISQSPDNAATVANAARTADMTDARARQQMQQTKTLADQAVTYQQDAEGNFVALPTKVAPGSVVRGSAVVAPSGMVPLTGKGAGMTEDQGKATGWLVQAENAYKNMMAVGVDKEGNPTSAARPGFNDGLAAIPSFGLTGAIANKMRGADRQKFMQATSSLSEALLRAATGAGVNRDEALQKVQELTPVFGEDTEATKQKYAAIPLYIESLKVRAGPGAKKAASVLQPGTGGFKYLGKE